MLTDDLLFSSRFLVVAGIRNHCLFTIQIMFQESVGDESWQAAVFMFEVYGIRPCLLCLSTQICLLLQCGIHKILIYTVL